MEIVMFSLHQDAIGEWARAHPDNLARVIQFAILSARVKFMNMPATIEDALRGRDGVLYGHKAHAWHAAWQEREANHAMLMDIDGCPIPYLRLHEYADMLVLYLSQLDGLGLVKGGFVAQMAFGVSGCIDAVNVARFGLKAGTFTNYRTRPKRIRTLAGRLGAVQWYHSLVYECGGPARLWDEWCSAMNDRYPTIWRGPFGVSEYHLDCLRVFPEGETL
jgi:hypothetical protein